MRCYILISSYVTFFDNPYKYVAQVDKELVVDISSGDLSADDHDEGPHSGLH
jgi:hypothetical protein